MIAPLLLVGAAALAWLERRRPLRRRVERSPAHDGRNVIIGLLGATAVHLIERPIVEPVAQRVEREELGLLPALKLPRTVETIAALLLLDYTLYIWHVLVHRSPWLWRFHRVHHVDRDLTASTAIRFHFGELSISAPWRAAQVRLIGVRPEVLHLWQQAVLASILFHHSNLRLPHQLEAVLSLLIVTPRLHGIHHSVEGNEMDSNWSSGLTIWDRLHGTFRRDVPQESITIGVSGYERPEDVTLERLVVMPFESAHRRVRESFESR